jgi:hypothetical protein
MIDQLLHLPYVSYWLPIAAAAVVAVPLLWLCWPSRSVAPAPVTGVPPDKDPTPGYAADQRRSFRRGGNSIGILYKYAGQENGPAQASVQDRSIGGVCLLTHETIPVGLVLSIRPTNADSIVPWVDVEVCTCRPGEECFEIGCRFVKTPPYSILLLFG